MIKVSKTLYSLDVGIPHKNTEYVIFPTRADMMQKMLDGE